MADRGAYIQRVFLSQDSWVGVPKSCQMGLPRLWSLITLRANLWSKYSLKQSCSFHQELSNRMWHVPCSQVNRVDSRLLVVGSQIGSLTPGPSFGHNLCFRCPNEQCEPILDIYVPRTFQWYKEHHKPLSFNPWNFSLKFWESTETPSPKVGVALGVWGFTPSYSLTLSYILESMWGDSRASSWPATLQPLCLGHKPKAKVVTSYPPMKEGTLQSCDNHKEANLFKLIVVCWKATLPRVVLFYTWVYFLKQCFSWSLTNHLAKLHFNLGELLNFFFP